MKKIAKISKIFEKAERSTKLNTTSGLPLNDSGCSSKRLGYSFPYRVCHADVNGPPNFLI